MPRHAYKLNLQPLACSPAALAGEVLAGRLPDDAVVRSFVQESWGHSVEIGFDRESHLEALNAILVAVQEVGYSVVNGQIAKLTDRALETAVGLGLGALGVGSTKGEEVAVVAAAIGGVVGLFIGSRLEKAEPIFEVQLTYGGWRLIPVEQQTALRPALEAGA